MRLHILIPAFLAGAVLTAAGPLITDASLIAQMQAEITTCRQCANNLCGLCPPALFCAACFDKANCYACPYMESCSEKDPCVCYDFCSKGTCKGTEDCNTPDLVAQKCSRYCQGFCSSYPAVELASQSTACSASFIELFHTSLPVDSVVGYNIGSGDDAISDAWGLPSRLGGVALVNAGEGALSTDLFLAEDAVLPEQDTASPLAFDQDLDMADMAADMFAMAPPYVDGSSSSAHPLSDEDWLRADGSMHDPLDDQADDQVDDRVSDRLDDPLDPDDYYDDEGLLVS